MSTAPLIIGTFGHGCVGQGFLELLDANGGTAATVKHVCVKDRARRREVGRANLTYEAIDILGDNDVRTIVELTNDPGLALHVIREALRTGRNAITASKKVVAENLVELIALQRATGQALLYEASCAASIPVLRVLETHFSGEQVVHIEGILNGTTNYILTRAQEEGLAPDLALREAQHAGFAEADPSSDLSGADARYKLAILIAHAFGTLVRPAEILCQGIAQLETADLHYAGTRGGVVRLVASAGVEAGALTAQVLPTLVPVTDAFALVRNEYNAVRIEGLRSGTHLLQGKGAGRLPTGLAVLSDVQHLARGGRYTYPKVNAAAPRLARSGTALAVYLRLPVTHQEVLGRFEQVRTVGITDTGVQVEGLIRSDELESILGEGRDGFQVIALPHLSADNER